MDSDGEEGADLYDKHFKRHWNCSKVIIRKHLAKAYSKSVVEVLSNNKPVLSIVLYSPEDLNIFLGQTKFSVGFFADISAVQLWASSPFFNRMLYIYIYMTIIIITLLLLLLLSSRLFLCYVAGSLLGVILIPFLPQVATPHFLSQADIFSCVCLGTETFFSPPENTSRLCGWEKADRPSLFSSASSSHSFSWRLV